MHYAIPVLPQMMLCSDVAYFKRCNPSSPIITMPTNDLKNDISLHVKNSRTLRAISIIYYLVQKEQNKN